VIRSFDIPIRTAREGEPLSGRFAPEVRLWPLPPGRFNASINSNLSGVTPGDYRVEVSSATYVKSMKLGDVEVTGNVIHIGTQPPGSLDLMFPRDPARISGHALDPVTRERVPASTVVLVPADRSRMELYRVGSSDNSGAFRFEGMKPGNYKVFAWRLVAHDAWKIPGFLSEYESRGVAVQIEDGMRTAFDVEVIP